MKRHLFISTALLFNTIGAFSAPAGTGDLPPIYEIDAGLEARSISFENPTGARGEGGKAASPLGVGRKGAPLKHIAPGEEVQLCNIPGTGTIRHIWMTGRGFKDQKTLRSWTIRAWWDGQAHPSIECPLSDFMGLAHGYVTPYQSSVHTVGEKAALNFWAPMPFTKSARITLKNETATSSPLYYQVDYTLGDKHSDNVGRLHTLFRRENPTTMTKDFVLLPKRTAPGRFLGCVMGVRSLDMPKWWGEGEVKFYMDGDTDFPTICGTGAEDYVCLSYGVQQTPYLYHGCTLDRGGYINMYRWHIIDPIYWKKECRVTIQQIGHAGKAGLYERQDDWSTATFWYEAVPSAPLPELPSIEARTADIQVPQLEDKTTTASKPRARAVPGTM